MKYFYLSLMFLFACGITKDTSYHIESTCGNTKANQKLIEKLMEENKSIEVSAETRIFKIRFFSNIIDENVHQLVGASILRLNQSTAPYMFFEADATIYKISDQRSITTFRDDFLRGGNALYNLSDSHIERGWIHVFITNSDKDAEDLKLLGFTPVLSRNFEEYTDETPRYDKIFISQRGLEKVSTLAHEVGHFFSLTHPWELDYGQKKALGLVNDDVVCVNLMNYNCFVRDFTEEQLRQMVLFASNFRRYLSFDKIN